MRITGNGKPVILVVGATGMQGGSVARHLLERGKYAVRALTRQPRCEEAQALKDLGAEVVRGNLDDTASLRDVMAGCYGVYGLTNFWEHFERELEHGINLVDAVADSGIGHFVFSTLPAVERLTNGELRVRKFDLKARMEEYAREQNLPATYVHVAYYFNNFFTLFAPQKQQDGSYRFAFPQGDTRLAGIAAEDIGGAVATIFEQREKCIGKTLYLVGDDLPPSDYAAVMTRISERPVTYTHIPREAFAAYRYPVAEDVANMFEFYRTRVPNREADLLHTRELYPAVRSFEAWFASNREKFEAVLAAT